MLTTEEAIKLSELLFPGVSKTREDLEKKYPPRGTFATRFAPSPTWYLHIGGVYQSLINNRIAHANGGVFYLRIEDTDQEREVEGWIDCIIRGLAGFDLKIDEGPLWAGYTDVWAYGPYIQSKRVELYHVMAKSLVAEWKAYPCFLTEQESAAIREEQNLAKRVPGIYGSYARWRDRSFAEYQEALDSGKAFVIRFRSPSTFWTRVKVQDEIRGVVEMDDNYLDIVVLKKDGIPTYHFAHAVDDHFMRTSHVIRAEEWFPSLPLHYQLFQALWFEKPLYLHTAQLMKIDNGNKRKLSKRKDPEAAVDYFFELGYEPDAVMDYLANIVDSRYEEWKKENTQKSYRDYVFGVENMPKAGALFDMVKLNSINKEYVSVMSHEAFFEAGKRWAKQFDHELSALIEKHGDLAKAAMNIERLTEKDPKRFIKISDIRSQLLPFFPETYAILRANPPSFPDHISRELLVRFLSTYAEAYDPTMDKDAWFTHLKEFGQTLGFAMNNEQFKQWGYVGKTGDLAMILRIALCCSATTPDLYETLRILWKETVISRLRSFC